MTSMFGPHGQRVLALITCIQGLSADQVDQVTSAWRRSSPGGRARAWAQLNRTTAEDERYRILAAASLARREALAVARRTQRTDWAFWAAACDAGAAAAAGDRIGLYYDTLVAPVAQVMPALADRPAAAAGLAAAAGHVGGGVGAVTHADLAVGVRQVPFDGVDADHEFGGDLHVGVAEGQQVEDLGFAEGQAVRPADATPGHGGRFGLAGRALAFGQQAGQDARVREGGDEVAGLA